MNTTTTNQSEQKTVLLSKKGMKELRKSIAQLEHDRQSIRRSLRESDKTSNHDDRFERSERLQRLETLESELVEKQQALVRAKLIPSKRTRMKVAIGSVVDLIDQSGRIIATQLLIASRQTQVTDAFLHSVHLAARCSVKRFRTL